MIGLNIKDEQYTLLQSENNKLMPYMDPLSDEIAKNIKQIPEINED